MSDVFTPSELAEAIDWINRAFRAGIQNEITHEEEANDEKLDC